MTAQQEINVGDRVWAYYREHSIPTRAIGTVADVVRGWVTVVLDPPVTLESGDHVVVPIDDVAPVASRGAS